MKMFIFTFFVASRIWSADWSLTITEQTVTEQQLFTLGTHLNVGECTSFIFDSSIMSICRHTRRVSYDLKFRGWFE